MLFLLEVLQSPLYFYVPEADTAPDKAPSVSQGMPDSCADQI